MLVASQYITQSVFCYKENTDIAALRTSCQQQEQVQSADL